MPETQCSTSSASAIRDTTTEETLDSKRYRKSVHNMAKLHESRKIEKVDKIKHKKAKNYTKKQLFEFLQENKELLVGFEKRTQKPKKNMKITLTCKGVCARNG